MLLGTSVPDIVILLWFLFTLHSDFYIFIRCIGV